MKNSTQANKLAVLCKKSLRDARYEYRGRKIKGVLMSHADIEMALFYARTILRKGAYSLSLMQPCSAVRELMDKFGLLEN